MCDGSGATSWHHDPVGRVLQDDRFIGSVTPGKFVNYGYNLDGSIAYITTPPLKTVAYTYNGAGRPTKAVDGNDSINFVTGAAYAPPGGLTTTTLGSATGFAGIVTTNAYNDRLQPILLSAASPTATVFSECFDFHLAIAVSTAPCSFSASTAGDNGNVNQVVNNRDNTRSQNFTYDSLNRIATGYSTGSQWGEQFTIDAWGNMTNESAISGKTLHEGLNTSALLSNQLSGFGYDAAGNMTSNGTTTYVYDAENRLVWTSGYRYVYDGDGQRVEKCVAATATTACPTSGTNGTLYWRGFGTDALDESDLSGNPEEEYVFFNGQRIARRDVSSGGATIAVHYYFSDYVGSHGVIENATGTACEQDIDYYPYGGVEHDYCPNVAQNYKFDGKERDPESGLDNFGARYDASSLGRFMTPDWAAKPSTVPYAKFGDPQTLNLYAFVENGPVNRIDADGHVEWAPHLSFGVGPLNIGSATAEASWGGGMSGVLYSETMETTSMEEAQAQTQSGSARLGIGIEVPANSAVHNNVLDVTDDPGHAFVYLRDSSGKVISTLSFGPGAWIAGNLTAFLNGQLAGNANWPVNGSVSTWESNITSEQLKIGIKAIADFKANVPNYSMSSQCTTAALSIAQKVGLTLPSGVGPVTALGHNQNVANPYHLSQQMRSQFGPPQMVGSSEFEPPKW
jgi:RHS repeat-associated protein